MRNLPRTQRSFTSGEISPLLHGRADLDKFRAGLALCKNFVVLPHGGVTRRSGSRFIAAAQSAGRLAPFQFSRTVAYMIELFNQKARFYKDKAQILAGGGGVYEAVTPWTAAQLSSIDRAQSADVLYVVHGAVPETRLERLADNNWNVVTSAYEGGPFRKENDDKSVVLYITDAIPSTDPYGYVKGDSLTLKASGGNVFTANMVGGLFKLSKAPLLANRLFSQIGTWEDKDYALGTKVRVGDNYYVLTDKAGAAFVKDGDRKPPTHTEGEEWVGTTDAGLGVQLWRYMHPGFGIVKITAQTSATQVTVDVVSEYLPDSVHWDETGTAGEDGGTHKWAEGAWSDERGYPDSITFHEQRKLLTQGQTVYGSVSGDFENMAAGSDDDEAFLWTLANGEVNDIQWIQSGRRLAIGTVGSEFALTSSSVRKPLTPTDVQFLPGSDEGSKRVRPVKIGNPVFVAADGVRLLTLAYNFDGDELIAEDLSILSDHLIASGVEEIAWARDPYRVLWCRLGDGTLAAVTYWRDQKVLGWSRHDVGGFVESIATIHSGTAAGHELWMIVKRTIDGSDVRYIEVLEPYFERSGGGDLTEAWFLDSALQYSGAAASIISGLDHLEGETVDILADGKAHPAKTVTGGQITLDYTASKVTVGLGFESRIRTLILDGDDQFGSLTTRSRKVNSVAVRLKDTVGGQAQCVAEEGENALDPQWLLPSGGGPMGVAEDLRSGLEDVGVDSHTDFSGQVEVFQAQPLPMTILGVTPNYQVES